MNENIKTYCPYCGIELDITDKIENKRVSGLYNVEGCCCNCENKFHWIAHIRKDGTFSQAAFSNIYKSGT